MLSLTLWCNWGGQAGGSVATGSFRALGTSQVELQEESLAIELYRDRAKVRVDYTFRNTADAVDVKAGFPCLGLRLEGKDYIEVEDYQMTADGAPVPYRIETGDVTKWKRLFDPDFLSMDPDSYVGESKEAEPCGACRLWWLASTVHFEKGETKHIAIRYESLYENSSGGASDDADYNDDHFRYLLSTAGSWKGPIQKGKVVLKAVTVDPGSLTIRPAQRFRATPDGLVWEFTNLRPTLADDIVVGMNDKFYTRFNYAQPGYFDNQGDSSWYSFEGSKYYFDFHDYTATASSEKAGYPAGAVGDFDHGTAWVAGKNGGIDESLTLTLKEPQRVDQIGIIPGYAKSKELYFANNRIRELEVMVNGRHITTATLPDEYISFEPLSKKAYQLIDLGQYVGQARTITLIVRKVYPGSKYDDTCISEVLLRKRLKTKPDIRGAR
jgi:hypothetical protein